jgi:hypothetical protein
MLLDLAAQLVTVDGDIELRHLRRQRRSEAGEPVHSEGIAWHYRDADTFQHCR